MRFRFRFGLRTLLLLMTFFAAFFGLVERRAHQQRNLKRTLSLLNAGMAFEPNYKRQPMFLTKLFGQDRTMTVIGIRFIGYQAPNLELDSESRPYALVSPKTVKRLIEYPAMLSVKDLEIIGTSTTADMVPRLSELQRLERLQLTSSMLVRTDLDSLRTALPKCAIDGSSLAHTTHWIRQKIPESRLPDLTVFSRGRDGDPEAIDELIELSSDPYLGKMIDKILVAANVVVNKSEAVHDAIDGTTSEHALLR